MRLAFFLVFIGAADALARPRLFYSSTGPPKPVLSTPPKLQLRKAANLLLPTVTYVLSCPLRCVASSRDVPLVKPGEVEVLVSLLLAAICGAFIGVERRNSERPAGVRTMSLVAMGSCIFGIISRYGFNPADRSRVAASVASGVGFIGAGVITRLDNPTGSINVKGLTTASTIWIAAAMGLACGSGLYFTAFVSTAFTLFVLRSNRFRRRLANRMRDWADSHDSTPRKKKVEQRAQPVAVYHREQQGTRNGSHDPSAAVAAVEAAKRAAEAVDASLGSIPDATLRTKVRDATHEALELARTAAQDVRNSSAGERTPAGPDVEIGGNESLNMARKAQEDYHNRMEEYHQQMDR